MDIVREHTQDHVGKMKALLADISNGYPVQDSTMSRIFIEELERYSELRSDNSYGKMWHDLSEDERNHVMTYAINRAMISTIKRSAKLEVGHSDFLDYSALAHFPQFAQKEYQELYDDVLSYYRQTKGHSLDEVSLLYEKKEIAINTPMIGTINQAERAIRESLIRGDLKSRSASTFTSENEITDMNKRVFRAFEKSLAFNGSFAAFVDSVPDEQRQVLYDTFRILTDDIRKEQKIPNEVYYAHWDLENKVIHDMIQDIVNDYPDCIMRLAQDYEHYYGINADHLADKRSNIPLEKRVVGALSQIAEETDWYDIQDGGLARRLMENNLAAGFMKHDILPRENPTPVEMYEVIHTACIQTVKDARPTRGLPASLKAIQTTRGLPVSLKAIQAIQNAIGEEKRKYPSNKAYYDAIIEGYYYMADTCHLDIPTEKRIDECVLHAREMDKYYQEELARQQRIENEGRRLFLAPKQAEVDGPEL